VKEGTMKTSTIVSIGAAALLLAACGGGSDAPAVSADAVPANVNSSTTGLTDWLALVTATAPEDKEALAIASVAPPQPDDTEPVALK